MAGSRTHAVGTSATPDIDLTPAAMDDGALIEQVSVARVEGADDEAAVRELLRRASEANRAALDRLAR